MNMAAIEHIPTLLFRQPIARNAVRFRLLTAREDIARCSLVCWKRSDLSSRAEYPMRAQAQDQTRTEWTAEVAFPEEAHYIKYFFCLTDLSGDERFYCEQGILQQEPVSGFFELLQVNLSDVIAPPEWAAGTVYYQIFPERFARGAATIRSHPLEAWDARPTRENYLGGDLTGICQKLSYLQELGVECLYLTPVFAGDFNHKYATTDYFAIDPDFGTEQDLVELVRQAHKRGIRVLLDGVFNHTGVHFAPFEDLMANGPRSRFRDWFYPKRYPISIDPACYECVGDYPYMPRLNTANPQVQAFILAVMRYWLIHAGIDGWRLDVADELDPGCVRYLRRQLRAEFPDALLLGETWGDATRMLCENDQFDTVMNYLFRDAMVDYFAHETINEEQLDGRLGHMLMKYPPETARCLYNCLSSHDTARFLTEAGGDRWRLKLAIAFQMLFPGSPAVYYGEEIGMQGENDPGCRAGMAWDHMDEELLAWTRRWIRFRHDHPSVREGAYRTLLADNRKGLFAFERTAPDEHVTAVFNRSGQPQDFAAAGGTVTVPAHAVEIIIL